MVSSIDIRHWLTESGYPHPQVRRRAMRVKQLGRPHARVNEDRHVLGIGG